jgi:hypothetical protein
MHAYACLCLFMLNCAGLCGKFHERHTDVFVTHQHFYICVQDLCLNYADYVLYVFMHAYAHLCSIVLDCVS